jgi:hypothetical protein
MHVYYSDNVATSGKQEFCFSFYFGIRKRTYKALLLAVLNTIYYQEAYYNNLDIWQ